uniref:Serine/threonine-protein phosphatase 2A activator n=1 Tax=Brugia malayi TaxID=6279 RepID=A0A0J9Y081_BRUMA|nr:Bm7078, isoform b [Brugia malayi]
MYEAEVLKKFPVVQHFQFGSLFSIEPVKEMDDPNLIGTGNDDVIEYLADSLYHIVILLYRMYLHSKFYQSKDMKMKCPPYMVYIYFIF